MQVLFCEQTSFMQTVGSAAQTLLSVSDGSAKAVMALASNAAANLFLCFTMNPSLSSEMSMFTVRMISKLYPKNRRLSRKMFNFKKAGLPMYRSEYVH